MEIECSIFNNQFSMLKNSISKSEIFQILKQVKDPEVPVLDIAELGVLRDVSFDDDKFLITITPTYSGCPAMNAIEQEIKSTLKENGIENFSIKTIFSPAWTTDWMSDQAKQKLKDYGIAPPAETSEQHLKSILERKSKPVQCPFCNSTDTKLTSAFGSTACKALHFCNHCHQPFEEFKCH
jgi:ring-1,2-phenylacetyl-CoA epoxidase subunit PaaD